MYDWSSRSWPGEGSHLEVTAYFSLFCGLDIEPVRMVDYDKKYFETCGIIRNSFGFCFQFLSQSS